MLTGKKVLLTGLRNKRSVSFSILKDLLGKNAEVILTSPEMERTRRAANRLEKSPPVFELDVEKEETIENVKDEIEDRWGGQLDGLVHSIAYADRDCISDDFTQASQDQIIEGFRISSLSLWKLAKGFSPYLEEGGSVVSMSFDTSRIAPSYGWMNLFKDSLEYVSKMAAYELGKKDIRVNCISAGPMMTSSARAIPGFRDLARKMEEAAPLDWDSDEAIWFVAPLCSWLISEGSKKVTGEIIHLDGGANTVSGAKVDE